MEVRLAVAKQLVTDDWLHFRELRNDSFDR